MTPLELYKAGALTAGELAALQCACERGVLVGKGGEPELLLYVRCGDAVAPVSVGLDATVEDVREAAVAALSLTDADSCTLTLGGETLNLQSLCSDTNISSECTLQLERSAALELWRARARSDEDVSDALPVRHVDKGKAGCFMVSSREVSNTLQCDFVAEGSSGYLYFFVLPSEGPCLEDVPVHNGSFYNFAMRYYGWDTCGRKFSGKTEQSWGKDLTGCSWALRARLTIDPQRGSLQLLAATTVRSGSVGSDDDDTDSDCGGPPPIPGAVDRAADGLDIPKGKTWRVCFLWGSSRISLAVGPNDHNIAAPEL